MKTNINFIGTIKEAFKYASYVGCVYPQGEESYFLCSNLDNDRTKMVQCNDGYFFAEEFDETSAREEFAIFYDEEIIEKETYLENIQTFYDNPSLNWQDVKKECDIEHYVKDLYVVKGYNEVVLVRLSL